MAALTWSCSDNDEGFDPGVSSTAFTFTPVPGGAVMHYKMPVNSDITGLHVYYKDAFGKDMVRSGSTSNDSLLLIGFNEAQANVQAEVRLIDRSSSESSPIRVTFSTEDSDPVAFINNMTMVSDWGGFSMLYDNVRKNAEGLLHVFYLGTDPLSGLPDTLLIRTMTLAEASRYTQQTFVIKQDVTHPIVVVRCEDLRGNRIAEKTFHDVECMYPEKLDPSRYSLYCAASIYDDDSKIGPQYLFDGDTKGVEGFIYNRDNQTNHLFTFVAGPNAVGEDGTPVYLDLQKNKVMKSLRIYSQLGNRYNYGSYLFENGPFDVCGQYDMMPCNFTVFGAADDNSQTALDSKNMENLTWKELGHFEQRPDIGGDEGYYGAWCHTLYPDKSISTLLELENAEEEYAEINIPAAGQGQGYRYLKVVINGTFKSGVMYEMFMGQANKKKYFTFHELELYTKIDE